VHCEPSVAHAVALVDLVEESHGRLHRAHSAPQNRASRGLIAGHMNDFRTSTPQEFDEVTDDDTHTHDDAVGIDASAIESIPSHAIPVLVDAVARALSGIDRADRIARFALRKLSLSSHTARRTFARTVIGTAGLASRLAYRVGKDTVDVSDARLLAAAWLVDETAALPAVVGAHLSLGDDAHRALASMRGRAWPADARARLVVERAISPLLVDRLSTVLSLAEIDGLFAVMNKPGPMCARVDLRRTSREAVLALLEARGARVRAGVFAPCAIVFEARYDVDNCPLARGALYTVQDEGSQLIALALAPASGERILDLCAGRGGKTLALLEHAPADVELTASDIDQSALRAARGRLRRQGADGDAIVIGSDAGERERMARVAARGPFDAILVDAPCTSSGALRRGPDQRTRIDAGAISRAVEMQRALLVQATRLVKPGGRIIYATCSVLPDENDAVVDDFLARGDLVPSRLPLPRELLSADETRAHLWPHVHGTDGFFIAGLMRLR